MNATPQRCGVYWVFNDPRREATELQTTGVVLAHWDGRAWHLVWPEPYPGCDCLGGVTHFQPVIWPATLPPMDVDIPVRQEWRALEEVPCDDQ